MLFQCLAKPGHCMKYESVSVHSAVFSSTRRLLQVLACFEVMPSIVHCFNNMMGTAVGTS